MLSLLLSLSVLVFSSLSQFSHIHEIDHGEFENAQFHLHLTHADGGDCGSTKEEQPTDDHHWFELSHEAYNSSCVPILHQGFFPDNLVKHVSHQSPICSPWNSFFETPPDILMFERGSPSEAHYSQIIPHFFTDLSPPLC